METEPKGEQKPYFEKPEYKDKMEKIADFTVPESVDGKEILLNVLRYKLEIAKRTHEDDDKEELEKWIGEIEKQEERVVSKFICNFIDELKRVNPNAVVCAVENSQDVESRVADIIKAWYSTIVGILTIF